MDTKQLSQSILDSIAFAKTAHIDNPNTPNDAIRFHDRKTPYIVHPIWCAMTILTETVLDEDLRITGYLALMWHDVLEDTKSQLPESTNRDVQQLIEQMTFSSFAEEQELIWTRSDIVRLLKLYDKTSNFLDGSHMSDAKWNRYVQFTQLLADDVAANYGNLNIIKLARAIAVERH
jgi:hypothetical protein